MRPTLAEVGELVEDIFINGSRCSELGYYLLSYLRSQSCGASVLRRNCLEHTSSHLKINAIAKKDEQFPRLFPKEIKCTRDFRLNFCTRTFSLCPACFPQEQFARKCVWGIPLYYAFIPDKLTATCTQHEQLDKRDVISSV